MATPPTIRQITREAIGDVPDWFDRVLQPLNQFLQQVGDAVAGGLTVGQNLCQQWLTLTITEGVEIQPQALPKLRGRAPFGVTVERVQVVSGSVGGEGGAVGILWTAATVDGKPGLSITSVSGLGMGAVITLTLLVKAE
jgi:hypothetical protein